MVCLSFFYSVVGDSSTTDVDYGDDLPLFTNTPVQAECQLHSLKQAEGVIELVYSDYKLV